MEEIKKNEEQKDIQNDDSKGISRRNFFKASGLAAGIAALGVVSKNTPVYAGEQTESPIVNLAVRQTDTPCYMKPPYAGADKLQRYDNKFVAFTHPGRIKRANEKGLNQERVARELQKSKAPGNTLLDFALYDCAWTINKCKANLVEWEGQGIANTARLAELGKWEGSPEENNLIVKKATAVFGGAMTGVAAVNEQWFYSKYAGKDVIFTDQYDEPTVTDTAKYIPKSMNRIVASLIVADGEMLKYCPTALGEAAVSMSYSRQFELTATLTEFIRQLGYKAIPITEETLSVPISIDAGLGELGRNGLCISPMYGPMSRVTARVLTDMPLAVDKPIEFGVAEFCKTCKVCADMCPAGAISKDTEPSDEIACESNNPGMKKWYVDTWACHDYWQECGTGCGVCLAVCPYSKPQTWLHDMAKGVFAQTPVFNSTFVALDKAFGYEKLKTEQEAKDFWTTNDKKKSLWYRS